MAEKLENTGRVLYRRRDLTDMTGLSLSTVDRLIASGEIETVTLGRARLVPSDALAAFVERLRSTPDSGDAA